MSGEEAGMRHGRGGEGAGDPASEAERWRCHLFVVDVLASSSRPEEGPAAVVAVERYPRCVCNWCNGRPVGPGLKTLET